MQPLIDTIAGNAANGYLPAAFFFPVEQHGKRRGMPLDFQQQGMTGAIGFAQLLMQRPPGVVGANEIILQSTPITLQQGFASVAANGFDQPVVILQRTFVDRKHGAAQPRPGFSFPRAALP